MGNTDLQAYYARDEERDRLGEGVGQIEFLRTVEVLERTLPPAGAVIADIGGGPGRYTDWLVDAGYTVVHRDIVEHHVEQVQARHGERVDSRVADAMALDLDDASVDAVLLLGPLYHLYTDADRVTALREAARVVRPGGPVFGAAISRWAPRMDGMLIAKVHRAYPVIVDMVDEMERTGYMAPVHESSFCGYSHRPDELRAEVVAAGLDVLSLVSVEGVAFLLGDLDERMADADERALLFDTLRVLESVPELLGVGQHLLVTARRR
jgi:SAM-dependent methyltransferase